MAVERLEAVPFVVVVFSLKVFADAARRKKVKRLSSTAEKKKRKKKRRMKTPLSFSSLSLSEEEDEDEDKDTNKRSNKRSLPSRPLFLFFLRCVGRGQKGRRGFSKGRRNEEKAYGSSNVLFLSFFSSKGLGGLFFVAEKQL